jgi:hypothetical protein
MFWLVGWFPALMSRALGLFEPDRMVRSRERKAIHVISLVTTLVGYYLISSSFFPQYNPVNTFRYVRGEDNYNFYSTSGGLYELLGNHLVNSTRGITITNDPTPSGSKEIAEKVSNDPISLAIVQSDVLLRQGYSEKAIDVIATVYEEKVHVFYNQARLHSLVTEQPYLDPDESAQLMIKPRPNALTQQFFNGARVRMQSSMSAPSMSLPGNILDICGLDTSIKPRGMIFTAALDSLVEGALDVVFWTGGAPNIAARTILENNPGKIGMMSVHPSLRRDLAQIYERPMKQTTFRPHSSEQKTYMGSNSITTLSTDAWLIANPTVPKWVIREVAERLLAFKPDGGVTADSPLYGRDFASRIQQAYPSKNIALLQTGLVLILFIYVVGTFISLLLLWLVSSRKESKYLQEITDIYSKALPMHTLLEPQECALNVPVVEYGAKTSVNKAVEGIAALTALVAVIRDDSVDGGITVNHQQHIMQTAYGVREILRSQLARGLERAGRDGCHFTLREIRNFFYAGYVSRGAYHDLVRMMESDHPAAMVKDSAKEAEAQG